MTDLHTHPPRIHPLAVSEREAARLIGVSTRTLYAWRRDGIGPQYRRIGGRILYPVRGIDAWLTSTPDPTGGAL